MVAEFTRVARRWLFLAISNKPTCGGCTQYLDALHQNGTFKRVQRLHSTTMDKQSWLDSLERGGATLVLDLPPERMGHSSGARYFYFVLRIVRRRARGPTA